MDLLRCLVVLVFVLSAGPTWARSGLDAIGRFVGPGGSVVEVRPMPSMLDLDRRSSGGRPVPSADQERRASGGAPFGPAPGLASAPCGDACDQAYSAAVGVCAVQAAAQFTMAAAAGDACVEACPAKGVERLICLGACYSAEATTRRAIDQQHERCREIAGNDLGHCQLTCDVTWP